MNLKSTKISALLIFTALILQLAANAQQNLQKTKAGIQSSVAIGDQTSRVLKTAKVLNSNHVSLSSMQQKKAGSNLV